MRKTALLLVFAALAALLLSLNYFPQGEERLPAGFSFGGKKVLDVPFVWQKPWFCSEASASMVLGYYGFNLTQDEINAMGYDRFEVLKPLMERYLDCEYKSLTPEELKREIDEGDPVMVRVRSGPYLHTVVVVGYDGEYVIVHDPGRGPYLKIEAGELWQKLVAALVFEQRRRS